jgi:hypothetical protein
MQERWELDEKMFDEFPGSYKTTTEPKKKTTDALA